LPTKHSLTKQLLIDIEQIPITEADLNRAGQHVLDWAACASLGRISAAGEAYQYLVNMDDSSLCTAIGGGTCGLQNAVQWSDRERVGDG
jgi:hypothetical protein